MRIFFIGLLALTLLLVGLFSMGGLSWLGLHINGWLGATSEQIRYDIQKESTAYRDGMQRNLMQMQSDWLAADTAGKAVIRASVLHQYSQTDTSEYPDFLKSFLNEMGL